LLSKQASIANGLDGYSISTDFGGGEQRILFDLRASGNNALKVETDSVFPKEEWHHIIATYNGSGNASGIDIYINGISKPLTISSNTLKEKINNAAQFRISGKEGETGLFNGSIDEVIIINKSLLELEISSLLGCLGYSSVFSCTPSCAGKECGDDGCGGSCGSCNQTSVCSKNICVTLSNCTNEEDCPADYYGNNYCSSNNVLRDFNNYSCVNKKCVVNVTVEIVQSCVDDKIFCNGIESCSSGVCVSSGDPCNDNIKCTQDSCNEGKASCDNVADNSVCIKDYPDCTESICSLTSGCNYLPSGCIPCDVINMPINASVGSPLLILPHKKGSFIDGGSASAIRGLDNLVGPYLGSSTDVGAYELGLGVPWHGPRNFTDLLAYGLPEGWNALENRTDQLNQIGNYTNLGALNSVSNNEFRLLITHDNPRAFILVTFDDSLSGDDRWNKYNNILKGQAGDSIVISKKEFRDGLGATIVNRKGNLNLLGARVDPEGVLKIIGGVDSSNSEDIQNDYYTFIRSLYYAWNLQDPVNPLINIDFVAPPSYGVVTNPVPGVPVIISDPESQTVTEGERVLFFVNATGLAPLSYYWQKNSQDLGFNPIYPNYTTTPTTMGDDGARYRVRVYTVDGVEIYSNEANLVVLPGPEIIEIIQHPQDQRKRLNEKAYYTVNVKGKGPLSYQWQRGVLNNGEYVYTNISRATSYEYQTSNIILNDNETLYRVIISNDNGSVVSDGGLITLHDDPVVQPSDSPVVIGLLHGDVTFTSASIIWDIYGDLDLDAVSSLEFRRKNTQAWKSALNLSRIRHWDHDTLRTVNRLTGSIFGLSPGTSYEVRAVLYDPDGGSEIRVTDLTTKSIPKISGSGRIIEVNYTDDLDTKISNAQPGDIYLFHAGAYEGNVPSYPGMMTIGDSGNYSNPILFRAYGNGPVNFTHISVSNADHVWIDGLTVTQSDWGNFGIRSYGSNSYRTDISITRNIVRHAMHHVDAPGNNFYISDNVLEGKCLVNGTITTKEGIQFGGKIALTRGHVASYNDISGVSDGISYGDGNIDLHNNLMHDISDDFLEPDGVWDNYRFWENLGYEIGTSGISFQPMHGGPWYFFRNQIAGLYHKSYLRPANQGQPFKVRSGGVKFVVGNTIVAVNNVANGHWLFDSGSVFANNFWAIYPFKPSTSNTLADVYADKMENISSVLLWDYNRYDVNPNNIFNGHPDLNNLENMHNMGIELNTEIVDVEDCTALPMLSPTDTQEEKNLGLFGTILEFIGDVVNFIIGEDEPNLGDEETTQPKEDTEMVDSTNKNKEVNEPPPEDQKENPDIIKEEDLNKKATNENTKIICKDHDGDGYNVTEIIKKEITGNLLKLLLIGFVIDSKSEIDCGIIDCNDSDSKINPREVEICDNGVDENCNGEIDENCKESKTVELDYIPLNDCKILDQANSIYKLEKNVESVGNCFEISAENITLDCRDNTIKYSSDGSLGHGVFITKDYAVVKNCIIEDGANSEINSRHGIWISNTNYGEIKNNRITTKGSSGGGIVIGPYSKNNAISNNEIITSGSRGQGYYLYTHSNNNQFSGNKITTSGFKAQGVFLRYSSNSNNFNNEVVSTSGQEAYGLHISSNPKNNFFTNLDLITSHDSKSYGVYLENFVVTATITNSKINSINSFDVYVKSDVDAGSSLLLSNTEFNENNISINNEDFELIVE